MANEHTRSINTSTVCESPSNDRAVTDTLNQVNIQLTNIYEPQISCASTNFSLNATSSQGSIVSKTRMFQVRRTFLLIVTFDLIFMALLWIIYNQILNITIDKAFQVEVIEYRIKNSSFDVVGLSGIRFVFLMIPYAILKWSHWIFVAFTTLSSTGFIIAKTCVFTIGTNDNSVNYVILIISFIIAWIEIWFFDYRVIPHERRLRQGLNQSERRPLLHSVTSGSLSPNSIVPNHRSITISSDRHQSFYSPIHSLDNSDTEEPNQQPLRCLRSNSNISQSILGTPPSVLGDGNNNEDYEKQAEEILDEVWRIYKDDHSWSEEAKSKDGLDIVLSKQFPKWGKVFRLISTITGSRADIVEMLFERQEDVSKWCQSVDDCRILEVINNNLYITYQSTNEQIQGFIAKRDFVNITVRRFIDDIAILAAQACLYPKMPSRDNCVRAENGPTAYIIEKIDETTCRFTWILNVDLKGWIPQYLINSSLATVQLDLIESFRNYLFKTIALTSSRSSSIDSSAS